MTANAESSPLHPPRKVEEHHAEAHLAETSEVDGEIPRKLPIRAEADRYRDHPEQAEEHDGDEHPLFDLFCEQAGERIDEEHDEEHGGKIPFLHDYALAGRPHHEGLHEEDARPAAGRQPLSEERGVKRAEHRDHEHNGGEVIRQERLHLFPHEFARVEENVVLRRIGALQRPREQKTREHP